MSVRDSSHHTASRSYAHLLRSNSTSIYEAADDSVRRDGCPTRGPLSVPRRWTSVVRADLQSSAACPAAVAPYDSRVSDAKIRSSIAIHETVRWPSPRPVEATPLGSSALATSCRTHDPHRRLRSRRQSLPTKLRASVQGEGPFARCPMLQDGFRREETRCRPPSLGGYRIRIPCGPSGRSRSREFLHVSSPSSSHHASRLAFVEELISDDEYSRRTEPCSSKRSKPLVSNSSSRRLCESAEPTRLSQAAIASGDAAA